MSERASDRILKNNHRYSRSASRPEIEMTECPKRVRRSSNPGEGIPRSRAMPSRPSISASTTRERVVAATCAHAAATDVLPTPPLPDTTSTERSKSSGVPAVMGR